MAIDIYTDGSCLGNPGKGGWAFIAVTDELEIKIDSGSAPLATNNTMELEACIRGLEWLCNNPQDGVATIYSDSRYVIDGITLWIKNWTRNDWNTAAGKPVKNRPLWEKLYNYSTQIPHLHWKWVKGHDGNKFNEAVDELARTSAAS